MSTPMTEPVTPTREARDNVVWPQPQPMSIICWPSLGFSHIYGGKTQWFDLTIQ